MEDAASSSSGGGGGGAGSLDSSLSRDGSGNAEIIKKGYLQKGPESRGDAMISISFHPKSFKKRFFYLKQQVRVQRERFVWVVLVSWH